MNNEQCEKRVACPRVSVSADLSPIYFKQKQGVTFVRLRS